MEKGIIVLRRHSAYTGGFPVAGIGNATLKEQETLGHLTPEGIAAARIQTRERIRVMGDVSGKNFLLSHSPTYWLDDPKLGQRAKETAGIIYEEIERAGGIVVDNRLDFRLGEALMFQTPFAKFLRDQFDGKQDARFWDAFERDIFYAKRLRYGAEGPSDIAVRIRLAVKNAVEILRFNEENIFCVWMVTHGDCIKPFGMALGAPQADIDGNYNGGFVISCINKLAIAHIAGKNYPV